MAIDDLADRFQAVDLLLNQNPGPGPSRYRGLVPPAARILDGPTYALVRPEFAAMRIRAGHQRGAVRRILVFLSGTDPHDVTRRAAEAATAVGVPVDVVVGAAYPFLGSLRAWAADQPLIELHIETRRDGCPDGACRHLHRRTRLGHVGALYPWPPDAARDARRQPGRDSPSPGRGRGRAGPWLAFRGDDGRAGGCLDRTGSGPGPPERDVRGCRPDHRRAGHGSRRRRARACWWPPQQPRSDAARPDDRR